MRPKESLKIREEMAVMHDDVLNRIEIACKSHCYYEACWLCYACFESRVNRAIEKICIGCDKPDRDNRETIGITTKLECLQNLIKANYEPFRIEDIKKWNYNLITTVKGWCKERNALIHNGVTLEEYKSLNKKIENLAKRGKELIGEMYEFGGLIRDYYYQADEMPSFSNSKCRCKQKCIK